MAFPDVTPEVILEAMNKFDREQRNTPAWEKWMEYENFRYALVHNERPYPVKQIVSIATGVDLKDFNSNTARNYLELKGFVIIPLDKLLEQDLKKKRMEYFSINPVKETTPESETALPNEPHSSTQTGKTLVERLTGAVGNTAASPDPNINWSKFGTPITTFEEWQKSLGAIKTDFIRLVAQNYPLWLEENYKENIIQAFFMDGGQPNLGVLLNKRLRINCYFNAEKFVFVTLINPTAANLDFLEKQISLKGNFRPRMNLDWLKEGVAFCFDLKNQEDYEVLKGYTSRLIEMEDSKTQTPGFATGAEANESESLKDLKSLLGEEEDLPLEEPEEELAQEKIDSISMKEWKAYVQANASQELVRKIANDYPDWLQKTFGDTIQIRKFEGVGGKALGVWSEEDWIINTYFNNKRNIFIHIKLNEEESEQLRQSLKNPNSLKKRVKLGQFGENLTYSLWLNNYPDYQAIKDILIKMLTPNGSAETESTMIEAAYTVLSESGGDSMNIKDILAQAQRRGLVDSELTSTELSSAMLRDTERFMQLNGNTWRINPDFNHEPTVKTKNRIKRLATNILYRATTSSKLQDYYLTDSSFNLEYEPDQNLNIKTGAGLLIAGPDGSILPLSCKVLKVDENQNLLTVEPVTHLSRAVTPLEIERITGQSPDFQLLDISESEYAEIIKAMGNEKLTEKALLDYVLQYITHSGYYFDKETLYNRDSTQKERERSRLRKEKVLK